MVCAQHAIAMQREKWECILLTLHLDPVKCMYFTEMLVANKHQVMQHLKC